MIRKGDARDIGAVVKIYDNILEKEAAGKKRIGWVKGVYPTERTAMEALECGELFVCEEKGVIVAAARINQKQVPEYANACWEYDVSDSRIMVLHTLVVDPGEEGKGWGRRFVRFYEEYALQNGCGYLRMDTNEINTAARSLYKKLGYREAGIVPCNFNGIEGVQLVCLEKKVAQNVAT